MGYSSYPLGLPRQSLSRVLWCALIHPLTGEARRNHMPLTPQDQQPIVAAHNAYRRDPAIHAPDVQWDDKLAADTQKWADYLATTAHKMQHSVAGTSRPANTGENIAS